MSKPRAWREVKAWQTRDKDSRRAVLNMLDNWDWESEPDIERAYRAARALLSRLATPRKRARKR